MTVAESTAEDLVHSFEELLPCEGTTDGFTPIQCAIILVDKIIDVLNCVSVMEIGTTKINYGQSEWTEVKGCLQKQLV